MIAIARNDPALAHGAAKAAGVQCADTSIRVASVLRKAGSVKAFLAAIGTLGARVIDVAVARPHGSRAKAYATILEPTRSGIGFTVVIMEFCGRRGAGHFVKGHGVPILLTTHALARVFQRSTGADDINVVAELLRAHLLIAIDWIIRRDELEDGEIEFVGRGGALCGDVEAGRLILKTWMPTEAINATVRRKMSCGTGITVQFAPEA